MKPANFMDQQYNLTPAGYTNNFIKYNKPSLALAHVITVFDFVSVNGEYESETHWEVIFWTQWTHVM